MHNLDCHSFVPIRWCTRQFCMYVVNFFYGVQCSVVSLTVCSRLNLLAFQVEQFTIDWYIMLEIHRCLVCGYDKLTSKCGLQCHMETKHNAGFLYKYQYDSWLWLEYTSKILLRIQRACSCSHRRSFAYVEFVKQHSEHVQATLNTLKSMILRNHISVHTVIMLANRRFISLSTFTWNWK